MSKTPRVDELTALWDDDGASRGAAFAELRELALDLEKQNAELLAALKFALECGEDGDWQSARRYLTEAIQPSTQEVSK